MPTDTGENSGRWQLRDLKGSTLVAVQAGAVLFFIVAFAAGMALRGLFRGTSGGSITFDSLTPVLILLGSIAAVVVVHEAVHAALFMLHGGSPRFGVKLIGRFLPVVYATSTVHMRRNSYIVVCLAPFASLTAVLLLVGILATSDTGAALALLMMALNASGSVGDFVTARMLLRYDPGTVFQDTEDGFAWHRTQRES